MDIKISPSLLSADFSKLAEEVLSVEQGGADWLHCDVMDGHFVPNITIGPFVIEAIKKVATVPLDVHIMISDPEKYAANFCDAGADILTFHLEATDDPEKVIQMIRKKGVKVGVSISPDTPVEKLHSVLGHVDLVLIMSVFPGFGGQEFIRRCVPKIEYVWKKCGGQIDIQVDGGVDLETIVEAAGAGANAFVAGTSVFKSSDRAGTIAQLRRLATEHLGAAVKKQ